MNYGNEEESGWDALASELGLEPAPPPPPRPLAPVEKKTPEPATPFEEPAARDEVVEVIPARVAQIEIKVTSVAEEADPAPFGEGIVEDAADVLDDEAPEGPEGEPTEGEGKGRRRRRRRRRKKGGAETVAEAATVSEGPAAEIEETPDADLLAFPSVDDDVEEADDVPAQKFAEDSADMDADEDEVEEIVPEIALAEEEEESTEPLPEWKVTAWTDLIATLYRPQDR